MSLYQLNQKIKTIKTIKAQMGEAKDRMTQWSPYPGCSNIIRVNYHRAYKDLGRLEKDLRDELNLLATWVYRTDFDVDKHMERRTPSWLLWILLTGFVSGYIFRLF
jgi:hypothetical protein